MNVTSTVAERVKNRLAELSMNAAEAARKAGLERTFVHDLLGGRKKTIAADALVSLADALNCSPEYLVGRSDHATRAEVHISGIIEPGAWRDHRKIAALPSARVSLTDGATKAYLARGCSANRLGVIDGTIILAIEHQGPVIPGEAYIVRREQGPLEELSIRVVRRTNESTTLIRPTEIDPEPIPATDPSVHIVGKVVKAVTLFGNLN